MKKIVLLLGGLLGYLATLSAQLTIQLTSIPENTPDTAVIFAAGDFNGWQPGDDNYAFTTYENGTYDLTFEPMLGQLEFKITRGSWESVEGNADGNFRPNRTHTYEGGLDTLTITIESWEDLRGGSAESTAAENVQVLDEDFYIPQLNRNRRIWLYLPPDYATSDKRYPVLYMHDGQNLFDAVTSFSGEWQVDESLNTLFSEGDPGVIVVGIDNGGDYRLDEYSPWTIIYDGFTFGGEGDQYVKFIIETLKPFIDENYRTFGDRNTTGIMGSSMGGLISLYAALEYPNYFGKVGVFSPSLPIFQQAFEFAESKTKEKEAKFYLLAGEQESEQMVPDLNRMYQILLANEFSEEEVLKITHFDGQHAEWYWAREFPTAYQWLFGELTTNASSNAELPDVHLIPNPADSVLYLETQTHYERLSAEIYSTEGRLVQTIQPVRNNAISVSNLKKGLYVVRILENNRLLHSEKVTVQ